MAPITVKISNSSGRPIVRFDRKKFPSIPTGPTMVRCGARTVALDFRAIAVNTARATDGGSNCLGDVLRGLFGPRAGLSGTHHVATLDRVEGEWTLSVAA